MVHVHVCIVVTAYTNSPTQSQNWVHTDNGVPPPYQYTFLGEEGCDSAHEFVTIAVKLEDY